MDGCDSFPWWEAAHKPAVLLSLSHSSPHAALLFISLFPPLMGNCRSSIAGLSRIIIEVGWSFIYLARLPLN